MKRSLVIHDLDWYREAVNFETTESIPYKSSLRRSINSLLVGSYWEADELHLTKDSCTHSFNFHFAKNGEPVGFNGGIILHGLGETFAIVLGDRPSTPFWSIHT